MKAFTYFILSMTLLSLLVGCNSSSSSSSDSSSGKISIQLTDAPFPSDLVSEANVTIDKIEIRRSDVSDGNPFVTLSEREQSFNLLDLTNGDTESLVDMEIEKGFYDLIRLYVAEASVVLSDGTKYDLKVPSGDASGIKIFIEPSIEVAEGLSADLLLDFDVSKSFVVQGNPVTPADINSFIFKPTIKAANLSTCGRLVGTITDSESNEPIEGATVSAHYTDGSNTEYITSTFTDESDTVEPDTDEPVSDEPGTVEPGTDNPGEYTILGLPEGTYDIVIEHSGYTSKTIEGIEITAGNATTLEAQLDKISTPQ